MTASASGQATPALPGPGIVTASPADIEALSDVIAAAFLILPPSRWLIEDPATRREIFPSYFRLYVEHTLTVGIVHTTPERTAAALWLPTGPAPACPPLGYDERLAAVTGRHCSRFAAFDNALDRNHPAGTAHHHLSILAVHPRCQGQGTGSMLLRSHHATLDHNGIPAYLEAASVRTRRLYQCHGYRPRPSGPIRLPDGGPFMWPMWRPPRPLTGRAPGAR